MWQTYQIKLKQKRTPMFHKPFISRATTWILKCCCPRVVIDKVSNAFIIETHFPAFRQWIFFNHVPTSAKNVPLIQILQQLYLHTKFH